MATTLWKFDTFMDQRDAGLIVIDHSITDDSIPSPAIRGLFAQNIFSIPQACAYPISGMGD